MDCEYYDNRKMWYEGISKEVLELWYEAKYCGIFRELRRLPFTRPYALYPFCVPLLHP